MARKVTQREGLPAPSSTSNQTRPVATRKAYGDALVAVGADNPRVVALDGEVSNSTYASEFAKAYPDHYFEMFIAEQQMIAAAAGLSVRHYVPFAPTFAACTRKRGADAELMLRQVVEAYKEAVELGDRTPRKTVAARFDYTPEHISRLLKRARQPRNGRPPLLGPDDPPASADGSAESAAGQPVVAAIVTSAGGVLVGRRKDGKPPWTLIAGEVEPGERPEDAAVREVKEEAGCLVRSGPVIGERVHPVTARTMIYMACAPTRGPEIFVGDEAELAEVRWASFAEALELMPDMFGPVREYLARELGAET